jgi:tetratricopeptide (TPR) repeat protein
VRFEPLFAFKAAAERLEGRKGVRAIDTTGIFVLFPGNAHIVQSRPDFLWTSVSEAEEYVLSLQRMGKEVGTATVPDTALLYPPDWGELEREKSYVAKVEALKEGEVVQSKKVRFKVLSLESQEAVEKERLAIEKNAPDTISAYLLLSELYKEYRLYGLAIDALRKLTTQAPEIPEFHRSLSEVYRSLGLTRESNEELTVYEMLMKGN